VVNCHQAHQKGQKEQSELETVEELTIIRPSYRPSVVELTEWVHWDTSASRVAISL
jgi:hypothetical protein